MTLEQYAYMGEIVAAIAVIASLIYIGSELRQNTEALQAQARFNLITLRTSITDLLMNNRDLLDALQKHVNGLELTPAEQAQVMTHAMRVLETWEWQYGEYEAGTLSLDRLPIVAWAQLYHDRVLPNAVREAWPIRKPALRKGFVDFIEKNVINRA